ncbi:hypothetical protein ATL40_0124 [Serinibacter salmoneus]|uniref:Very-short-patch-repair endonuclease n=2 Tax=Serinibacter salmoneus TaxID=556530 RepID=A0A2A9CVY7_9MICO|nr:hypothetical protein ATL40_0124 [Serinibacter salmoneus]
MLAAPGPRLVSLAMEPMEELRRCGGAARFSELRSSRWRLSQHIARGDIVQPSRGCYALPGAHPGLTAATRTNTVLSCVSALAVLDPDIPVHAYRPHLSAPPNRARLRQSGVNARWHYEHVTPSHRPRVACLEDAASRMALCQEYDNVVVVLDYLARRHGPDFLERVLRAVESIKPSRARALRVDVTGRSRSPMETTVRLALRRAGFCVAQNVFVPGVGEVDFVIEGVLVVELDGYTYHSGRKPFRDDRRRDRQALRLGMPVVRFAFEDADPARIQREITPTCRGLRSSEMPTDPDLPVECLRELKRLRQTWTAPETRASGWRHLRDADAAAVRRVLPPTVPWCR